MPVWTAKGHFILGMMLGLLVLGVAPSPGHAQDAQDTKSASASSQAASGSDAQAPDPLDEKELQVLVARVALYPDELVALVSAASLYPLQVVEAARYLDQYAKNKSLKPKDSWDGSVISLLNYPEIVKPSFHFSASCGSTSPKPETESSREPEMVLPRGPVSEASTPARLVPTTPSRLKDTWPIRKG